jgi:hypothetical protein
MSLKDNTPTLLMAIAIPYHPMPATITQHLAHRGTCIQQEQGRRTGSSLIVYKNTSAKNSFLARSSITASELTYVASVLETAILIVDDKSKRDDDRKKKIPSRRHLEEKHEGTPLVLTQSPPSSTNYKAQLVAAAALLQ